MNVLKRLFKRKKKPHKDVGKIGWVNAKQLGLSKGHYVYIRSVKNGKAEVNTFTSLERKNHTFKNDKLNYVRKGNIYAVSKRDCNLPRFSGLDSRIIKNIPLSEIKEKDKYKLKRRHWSYINKYVK